MEEFPELTQEDIAAGWRINYEYLEKVADAATLLLPDDCRGLSLETVQAILTVDATFRRYRNGLSLRFFHLGLR